MPDPLLCIAIYIIWWWVAFFAMLPIGVHSAAESGGTTERGNDPGAPVVAGIRKKALWAAGAAVILWIVTIILIVTDPFNLRPDLAP